MQTSNKEIRRRARQNLLGHFRVPMVGFVTAEVILLLAENLVSPASNSTMTTFRSLLLVLTTLVISIASAIFSAGFIRIHMGLARDERILTRMVFYGFRFHIERYLLAAVLTGLIYCIPLLPAIGASIYFVLADYSTVSLLVLVGCGIVSCVLTVWAALRLSLTFYLLVDRDELSAVEAIRISWGQMKYRCAKLLGLCLSFVPLYLAAICSFGIGFLWLEPYTEQAMTLFYFNVMGEA